jgi:hypothetical protein
MHYKSHRATQMSFVSTVAEQNKMLENCFYCVWIAYFQLFNNFINWCNAKYSKTKAFAFMGVQLSQM